MREARFHIPAAGGVECTLCPHHCRIPEGGRGRCRSRECRDGKLWALSYGTPCALAVDPVEKKPLNGFLPGTYCLSISCTGCNLSCRWCQNSDISQAAPGEVECTVLTPEEAVDLCLRRGLPSMAYTYTEPFTRWEYMYDMAVLAHGKGLKNILVSAGYVEQAPLRELLPYLDAANIDIKAMDDAFYRTWCGARLAPVLGNILALHDGGVHVEITNLLIPGLNDSDGQVRALCHWMVDRGLQAVPLHFSRYFPRYRMREPEMTPKATLLRAKGIALEAGCETVYLGNV